MNEKVSIGVPCFNSEEYIFSFINKIKKINYENLEIIIIDNDSSDKSFELLSKYKTNKIRLLKNKNNIGAVENFKKVFRLSTGKYFLWLSMDDYINNEAINEYLKHIKKYKCDLVFSSMNIIVNDKKIPKELEINEEKVTNNLILRKLVTNHRNEQKMNYLMYGFFDSSVLKKYINDIEDTKLWDRNFSIILASHLNIKYIKKYLFNKQINEKSIYERYSDEKYGKRINFIDTFKIPIKLLTKTYSERRKVSFYFYILIIIRYIIALNNYLIFTKINK